MADKLDMSLDEIVKSDEKSGGAIRKGIWWVLSSLPSRIPLASQENLPFDLLPMPQAKKQAKALVSTSGTLIGVYHGKI